VQQWNFSAGNEPSATAPNLRAALDRASKQNPIVLFGNDGHHGAYNGLGLARARNGEGIQVGYSKATLARDFAGLVKLIGVDASGEPNGAVNEEARDAIDAPNLLTVNFRAVMKAPEKVPERLNSVGITAIHDALVVPDMLPFYDILTANERLTVRVNLMQYYLPEEFKKADGRIDYDRLLAGAKAIRAKYARSDLIRAEAIKIFADGTLEGNPYAIPPTLPDSPSLKP